MPIRQSCVVSAAFAMACHPSIVPAPTISDLTTKFMSKPPSIVSHCDATQSRKVAPARCVRHDSSAALKPAQLLSPTRTSADHADQQQQREEDRQYDRDGDRQ